MIAILLAALALGTPAPAHVLRIIDGDTIVVASPSGSTTVRILGIDCPESHANAKCRRDGLAGRASCAEQVPAGRRATARAHELLDGRDVTLEPRSPGAALALDRYGRTIAYVRISDGTDFGRELVAEGLCEDFGWRYPHPRGVEYRAVAEGRAGR